MDRTILSPETLNSGGYIMDSNSGFYPGHSDQNLFDLAFHFLEIS